jgi:uncharacterized metal-binding protein YceD (DUF177 family)
MERRTRGLRCPGIVDDPMTDTPSPPLRLRTGGLSPRKPTRFRFAPDAPARQAIARALDLIALKALVFEGEVTPQGRDTLLLQARLTADAVQACVVTLGPVPARVDEEVRRRYVAGLAEPEGDEAEMPEDDSEEPMPQELDFTAIATEALALALPDYPRAPGAELAPVTVAPPGAAPLEEDRPKPFAGLAGLAERLARGPGGGTDGDPDDKT